MANRTINTYPVGLSQYKIAFDYLARPFVVVSLIDSVNSENNKVLKPQVDYRFLNKTTIEILTSTTNYSFVQIHRYTSTELVVDFRDGSVLTAKDLTNAELQAIHIAEEGRDQTVDLAKQYAGEALASANNAQNSADDALIFTDRAENALDKANESALKAEAEALRAEAAALNLENPITSPFSFKTGGLLNTRTSFIYDEDSKQYFYYIGSEPYTVKVGSTLQDVIDDIGMFNPLDNKGLLVAVGNSLETYSNTGSNEIHFTKLGGISGVDNGDLYQKAITYCESIGKTLSFKGMHIIVSSRNIRIRKPVVWECEITVVVTPDNKGVNVFDLGSVSWSEQTISYDYSDYSSRPFVDPKVIPTMAWVRWRPSVKHVDGVSREIQEFCVHTSDGSTIGKTYSAWKGEKLSGIRPITNVVWRVDDVTVNIEDTTPQEAGGYFSVFKISDCDNVYIRNFKLGSQSPISNPKAIFDIGGCYGVFLENPKATGIYSLNAATYGYIFNLWNCINVNFKDVTGNVVTKNWWSLYGANALKIVNHVNSHFYRYDNHSFVQDVYAENCTTRGSALSGNGFRRFVNCNFEFSKEEKTASLFYLRGLSQNGNYNSFSGDIDIIGGSIKADVDEFYFINASQGNGVSLSNKAFDSFKITGTKLDINTTGAFMFLPYRQMKRSLFSYLGMKDLVMKTQMKGLFRDDYSFIVDSESPSLTLVELFNIDFGGVSGLENLKAKRYTTSAHFPSGAKAKVHYVDCSNAGFWHSNCSLMVTGGSANSVRMTSLSPTHKLYFKGLTILDTVEDGFTLGNMDKILSKGCSLDGSMYLADGSTKDIYSWLKDTKAGALHCIFNGVYPTQYDGRVYGQMYSTFAISGEGNNVYFKVSSTEDLKRLS